jgi:hypothetical protein
MKYTCIFSQGGFEIGMFEHSNGTVNVFGYIPHEKPKKPARVSIATEDHVFYGSYRDDPFNTHQSNKSFSVEELHNYGLIPFSKKELEELNLIERSRQRQSRHPRHL